MFFDKNGLKSDFKSDKRLDLIIIPEYFSVMLTVLKLRYCLFLIVSVILMTPSGYLFSQRGRGIVLEEIEIKGKIQKPEAMYFLSRSRFDYRTLDLDISFVEKVEKALHLEDAF